jgi:hypothetical protein
MNKMLNREFQGVFSSVMVPKAKWGKPIPFDEIFRYSNKVLTESLLTLRFQTYTPLPIARRSVIELKEIRRGTLTELLQKQQEEIKRPKVITEKQVAVLQ